MKFILVITLFLSSCAFMHKSIDRGAIHHSYIIKEIFVLAQVNQVTTKGDTAFVSFQQIELYTTAIVNTDTAYYIDSSGNRILVVDTGQFIKNEVSQLKAKIVKESINNGLMYTLIESIPESYSALRSGQTNCKKSKRNSIRKGEMLLLAIDDENSTSKKLVFKYFLRPENIDISKLLIE